MSKARILVVEDEVIIAQDIQRTLIQLGYDAPIFSVNGKDALEQVTAIKPDLILMDIHLKGGMDGIAVADEIRRSSALPVVYLTAHSDEGTLRRARITEPYGYIIKPFEERELEIAVDIALYRHAAEKKLKQMERWLATTLKSIGDGVIATDTTGTVTFMNQMAETLSGWTLQEALGCPIEQILNLVYETNPTEVESLVTRVLREKMIIEVEQDTVLITRTGQSMPINDSAAPIRNDDGDIIGIVIIFRDVTARKQVEQQLRHLAMHDPLTGLPNRMHFTDRLNIAFEYSRRHEDYRFAVLFIDLDRFKVINDSLGHLFGDKLLVEIAKRLKNSLRSNDTIARLGGDEYAILVTDITDMRDVMHVAERIQKNMASAITINGQEVFTAASIGIAFNTSYKRPEDMLRDADTALYKAKELGRGRFIVFDTDLHERAKRLLQLETDLRRAIEREEFCIYYQPIVSIADVRVHGFEALLRWRHPELGLIPPEDFLAQMEESGLLVRIGKWMLNEACRQLREWQSQGDDLITIGINLSHKQFLQPDLVEQVGEALVENGLEARQLCLEITEEVIADYETTARILADLDALGVQLHIDDFGIGYSSLSKLQHSPIDVLKIDRSFVKPLAEAASENGVLVRTILLMAGEMGKDVVAEGIETIRQLDQLKAWGCKYGQGYLFAEPLAAEAAAEFLVSYSKWNAYKMGVG